MAARSIVRDTDVLNGRWRLAETMVAIADIRRNAHLGRDALKERYAIILLTDEEIDAVMAFVFPAVRDPGVSIHSTSITVHCPCGEVTDVPREAIVKANCVCGRVWRVSADIELMEDPDDIEEIDTA